VVISVVKKRRPRSLFGALAGLLDRAGPAGRTVVISAIEGAARIGKTTPDA